MVFLTDSCSSRETFTRFDVPNSASNPGISTIPRDINERGDIVGRRGDISGSYSENHGFIRSVGGRYTTFDVPGSTETVPTGINNLGHVVGNYGDQSTDHTRLSVDQWEIYADRHSR